MGILCFLSSTFNYFRCIKSYTIKFKLNNKEYILIIKTYSLLFYIINVLTSSSRDELTSVNSVADWATTFVP